VGLRNAPSLWTRARPFAVPGIPRARSCGCGIDRAKTTFMRALDRRDCLSRHWGGLDVLEAKDRRLGGQRHRVGLGGRRSRRKDHCRCLNNCPPRSWDSVEVMVDDLVHRPIVLNVLASGHLQAVDRVVSDRAPFVLVINSKLLFLGIRYGAWCWAPSCRVLGVRGRRRYADRLWRAINTWRGRVDGRGDQTPRRLPQRHMMMAIGLSQWSPSAYKGKYWLLYYTLMIGCRYTGFVL
jgi:hypothetical protein